MPKRYWALLIFWLFVTGALACSTIMPEPTVIFLLPTPVPTASPYPSPHYGIPSPTVLLPQNTDTPVAMPSLLPRETISATETAESILFPIP